MEKEHNYNKNKTDFFEVHKNYHVINNISPSFINNGNSSSKMCLILVT